MPRSRPLPARSALHRSWLALCILAAPILLGLCLSVEQGQATLFGLAGPACVVGEALGEHACPGCGLTRSTALVMHGSWRESFDLHPGGWLIVLLCAAGILVHADALRRGVITSAHDQLLRSGRALLVLGLAAAWIIKISTQAP